jgi:hypothetical protein
LVRTDDVIEDKGIDTLSFYEIEKFLYLPLSHIRCLVWVYALLDDMTYYPDTSCERMDKLYCLLQTFLAIFHMRVGRDNIDDDEARD